MRQRLLVHGYMGENGKKVLHLNIEVNRNRYENQMEYALSAMGQR